METTIMLGQYSLPVIISLILAGVSKFAEIPNRFKSLIAVGIGILCGIVAMLYNAQSPLTFKVWVDYVLYGAMNGAAATGLYELQKYARKPVPPN